MSGEDADDPFEAEWKARGARLTSSGAIITELGQNDEAWRKRAYSWLALTPRQRASMVPDAERVGVLAGATGLPSMESGDRRR